jgi:hypothetical protein
LATRIDIRALAVPAPARRIVLAGLCLSLLWAAGAAGAQGWSGSPGKGAEAVNRLQNSQPSLSQTRDRSLSKNAADHSARPKGAAGSRAAADSEAHGRKQKAYSRLAAKKAPR